MTELATPEGWTAEHQEHLEGIVAARKAEDKHVRWLVSRELEKILPAYAEAEEQAAEKVQAAYEALRDPESDLAAIEKEIQEVTGQCISWESKLTDSKAAMRVEAHARWSGWNNELDLLHSDREKLLRSAELLRDAYAMAKAELAKATSEREGLEHNIRAFPYWGLGHLTDSYQVWRANAGHLVPLLLSGDTTDMEWHAAFDFMDRLCARSGYRTEGRVPTNAEQTKRAMENYLAANSSVQSAPGMTDIMSQTQAGVKSMQKVPPDHWEYAPQVNPNRAAPDPSRAYQPLRNIRT